MARSGVVKKSFPFSADGLNTEIVEPGRVLAIPDQYFQGLLDGGFVAESAADPEDDGGLAAARDLNARMVTAFDRRLAAASDQDLKDIIARSGTPWSGNLVHAEMVAAAKAQMVREMEGAEPVLGVDPNSGVTEQPLAAPGAPTPPSAAAAVDEQKAKLDAAKGETTANAGAGENKATNQFGNPLPSRKPNEDLDGMTVADLKKLADERGVDLGDATKKADIIETIRAAK